jgi:hypothetical protein
MTQQSIREACERLRAAILEPDPEPRRSERADDGAERTNPDAA